MAKFKFLLLLFAVTIFPSNAWSCTIFCAKDSNEQVWAGNNEDYNYFTFDIKIKITPKTDSTFGFFYFTYTHNQFPQGGVNEAGLFFDFNAVEAYEKDNRKKNVPYPGRSDAMMLYMLKHCKTVSEAIELYEKYETPWMDKGQLHVADKYGNMGIMVADSAWITTSNYQVSTNFILYQNDNDYKRCRRYPIAEGVLKTSEPNFETFKKICDLTSQRKVYTTIYSNVHNLNTGEMRLYYAWDYETPYKTTINELMEFGDTLFPIRDLFPNQNLVKAYYTYLGKDFTAALSVLNEIDDSLVREDMLKLLALDSFFGSTRDSTDDDLVHQIIEASNHEELLSLISQKATLKANRKHAKKKLKTIKKAGISDTFFIWLIGLGIVISLIIIKKKKNNKRQLNKT